MSTNDSSIFLNQMLINGVCGASAVSVQTFSLMWLHTLIQEHHKTGIDFKILALRLYQKGGLRRFYQGATSPWLTASMARFGDTATNFCIMDYFSKNQFLANTPIFIQSGVTWTIASVWRLALVPLAILNISELNIKNIKGKTLKPINWMTRMLRTYRKQTHGEILALYSWFTTQNYLDRYLPKMEFQQSRELAFLRFSFIGFCSMTSLNFCLNIYQNMFKVNTKGKNKKNILLGEGKNKLIMKGFHGIIFCTSSNYIKQTFFTKKIF